MLEVNNMHTVLTYLHNLSKIPSLEPHITSLYTDFPKLAAIYTSEMVVVKEDDFRGFYSRLEKISIKCDVHLSTKTGHKNFKNSHGNLNVRQTLSKC